MPIKSAHLQNFTVFKELQMNFSNGVNVVIGTNGTGKTHLLKSMYGICEGINNRGTDAYDISQPYFSVNPLELVRDKINRDTKTFVKLYFSEESSASYHNSDFYGS